MCKFSYKDCELLAAEEYKTNKSEWNLDYIKVEIVWKIWLTKYFFLGVIINMMVEENMCIYMIFGYWEVSCSFVGKKIGVFSSGNA